MGCKDGISAKIVNTTSDIIEFIFNLFISIIMFLLWLYVFIMFFGDYNAPPPL